MQHERVQRPGGSNMQKSFQAWIPVSECHLFFVLTSLAADLAGMSAKAKPEAACGPIRRPLHYRGDRNASAKRPKWVSCKQLQWP